MGFNFYDEWFNNGYIITWILQQIFIFSNKVKLTADYKKRFLPSTTLPLPLPSYLITNWFWVKAFPLLYLLKSRTWHSSSRNNILASYNTSRSNLSPSRLRTDAIPYFLPKKIIFLCFMFRLLLDIQRLFYLPFVRHKSCCLHCKGMSKHFI